jgi:microcystin-dependent protein
MNNVSINNLSLRGKSSFTGDVSMNGIVTIPTTTPTLDSQVVSKSYLDSIVPIATIIMRAVANPVPTGYLLCNGALLTYTASPPSIYYPLYLIIGTAYGGVAGTNFNLPNFLGSFPVGLSTFPTMTYNNSYSGGNINYNVGAHSHGINANARTVNGANSGTDVLQTFMSNSTKSGNTESGGAHSLTIIPPYTTVAFFIRYL